MTKSVLKAIVAGLLAGAILYFAPMVFFGLLFFALLAKMMFFGGMMMHHRHGGYGGHHLAFADKIRSMSDEDYQAFKGRFASGHSCCCAREEKKN
jgi:hypothetical protein